MRKQSKRISSTARYLIMLGAILFAANIVMGVVLMQQSISMIQSMVRKSMLSVTTTAAALIDGDTLRDLTPEDIGSPAYELIYDDLAAFQKNVNIEYIYAVRQIDEDTFVFTVDPDPNEPAEFGEEVLVTDALRSAAAGTASVDNAPAEDEWGNFYSAYSPVFDSNGRVAGVIGVDFDAQWFSDQMMENSWSIILVSIISIAAACLIVIFVTGRVRKQYQMLNNSLSVFSSDMEELENEISADFTASAAASEDAPAEPAKNDTGGTSEIEELRQKMNGLHQKIREYLAHLDQKARTDAMTHVGNTTAYAELFRALDEKIADGTAPAFRVAVFDINYLKPVNDEYGHACGDAIIKAAAASIANVFGYENTFRIGGDEFTVIIENMSSGDMAAGFEKLDAAIAAYNESGTRGKGILSIAKGAAAFRPDEDTSFRQVFNRADKEMYESKETFHLENPGSSGR